MAGGFDGGGRGKNRITNLNLVPFVDLFSTMIIFLIFTAVWDQLTSVKMNLGATDKASVEAPPEDIKKIASNVKVRLGSDFYELFDMGRTERVNAVGGNFDFVPLEKFVTNTRAKYETKKDMLIQVMDDAPYEDVIAVMDRFLAKSFSELIVTGGDQKL